MNGTRPARSAAAVLALALLAAPGCSSRDRAGGVAAESRTTLTFAQGNDGDPPEQLARWADQVASLSHGTLRIRFRNGWRLGEVTYETATIGDIRRGKVDMGWVGARALDRVGVTSFQALLAPMLVDSQELQARVFTEGIPEEMLADLHGGITGVGVLPGPMRKMLGVAHPFVRPADFAGATVGMQDSGVAAATFAALGARGTRVPSGAELDGLDAIEQQVSSIWGNQYQVDARYLTGNIDLWPRPLVLLVNDDVYAGLSRDQQRALRQAGRAAVAPAIEASRAEDADDVDEVCDTDLQIRQASAEDLQALRDAVDPVYRQLRRDPKTAAWLDRISQLKSAVGAPPDAMRCGPASDRPSQAGPLPDGTYRNTLTVADARAACSPGDQGSELLDWATVDHVQEIEVTGTRVLQTAYPVGRPDERENGWHGRYQVFRKTLELREDGVEEPLSATWTFDGRLLTLSGMTTPWCDAKAVWTSNPWRLVSKAEQPALTLEGTWTTVLTAADGIDESPGTFTMTFDGDSLQLTDPSGEVGFYGDYTAFRNKLAVTGGPDELHATYHLTGDRLTFRDVTVEGCPDCTPYVVTWESHPWVRQR